VNDTSSVNGDKFDRLLGAMPRIVEAVNAFSSEKNQRAALDALVQAIGIAPLTSTLASDPAAPDREPNTSNGDLGALVDDPGNEVEAEVGSPTVKPSARRRRALKKAEPVRDIDFRPEGKQAFKDLAEEKQPTTIDQKNLLAVFWLEQVASIQEIGVGHVMAAYKDRNWREPANPANSLQATASREHWIDTKNMKAIITTPSGRNEVNFEMPTKAKK
jgi:hypothetical protein